MAIAIFFSYAHQDEHLRAELEAHLATLRREQVINAWHDRRIGPGDDWRAAVDEHLEKAEVVLLLVSADFLASDYCHDTEVTRTLEKERAGQVRAIPVILRACDWKWGPLGLLQPLPQDGKPVTSWQNRDEAWHDVILGLRRVIASKVEDRATQTSDKRTGRPADRTAPVLAPKPLTLASDGVAYVEREADAQLVKAIHDNQAYLYLCAPRQSGKSSMIVHTKNVLDLHLDEWKWKAVLVDLSVIEKNQYDSFMSTILQIIAKELKLSAQWLNGNDFSNAIKFEDLLIEWKNSIQLRLIIFLDEIDNLQDAPFKEKFMNTLRYLYNNRLNRSDLNDIQFVLSGSIHPTILIPNPLISPFNIGKEIPLTDFTLSEVAQLSKNLEKVGVSRTEAIADTIYKYTSGLIYLSQLILQAAWKQGKERSGNINSRDITMIIKNIIANAHQDIHFLNIYNTFVNKPPLLASLQRYYLSGSPPQEDCLRELITTGLCNRDRALRCRIYERVFGPRGHSLALVRSNRGLAILLLLLLVGFVLLTFRHALRRVLGLPQ